MVDPDDLNVDSVESYERFAQLAEMQELEWTKDYTLTADAIMIEDGLTEWELEFVIEMRNKMTEQHNSGKRAGLTPAQRNRLTKILERLEC